MSQKSHDTVKYWNEITANTRNTEKLVKINWTIENNFNIGSGTKISGPDFYLQINCLCSISLEINYDTHFVFLVSKSDSPIKIQSNIIISDCNGTVIHEGTNGEVFTLNKNSRVNVSSFYRLRSALASLKEGKLMINCVFNVIGIITTKINIFKSEIEPLESLVSDWKEMYNKPGDSDFTLLIGEKTIHAHKTVLLARSAYFRKMFKTEMKEQTENTVLITDVLYSTMQKLVEFLYTGSFTESHNDVEEIFNLYIAADKYDIKELRAICGEKLLSTATTNNACEILQLAQRHSDEELKIRMMDFILFQFDVIEKSDAWKKLISSEFVLASEVWNFCFKHFKNT